ncbi:MAG: sugar ABC transporter permease [Chloroflexi bacterium]|nr:sugar ABC transporter permease [Chloroflexota bacterium]MCY3583665.1 sugar ABC transporter permease [Chloroflexota bacterium]MCY3716945.1 sugar ABC transporter permease [Chloroflexota bacterium]MDE2650129.1 sugar ABC transporter permease [Chloroflexota bacterium]MXX49583.1 sugar ABC transporter permease [Chloroflexota bacterium]
MRQKPWVPWLLIGPALLVIVLTTIYPLLAALYYSFHSYNLRRAPQFAVQLGEGGIHIDWSLLSLDNYTRAFSDSRFINSLEVTFWFTVISVGLSVIIGLFIAVIVQKGGWLHTLTKVLLIFPFAVSPALKGYSWRFMLNENYGIYDLLIDQVLVAPLNALISLLNALPLVEIPYISESIVWLGDKFWALFMLAMSETWGWAPLIALMFVGALGSIDEQVFEAARIDGANRVQIFFRVTLPLLRPVILIVTMLKTIFSLKMFDQVVTMTGGGPVRATQTINYYIHQMGFVRSLDIGYASAMSYILVIVLTICAALYVALVLNRD